MGFRRMAQRSFSFAVEGDENWLIIFFEKNLTPSPKIIFFSFLFLYYELTRQDGSLTEENVQKKVETVVLQLLKFKIIAGFVKADKLKSGIHTNVYVSHSGKKWFTFQSSVKVASIFFHSLTVDLSLVIINDILYKMLYIDELGNWKNTRRSLSQTFKTF